MRVQKGHIETGNWVLSYLWGGKVVEKQPSSIKQKTNHPRNNTITRRKQEQCYIIRKRVRLKDN